MKEVNEKQRSEALGELETEGVIQRPMDESVRLAELRREIDLVDEELVKLLVKRFAAVTEIASLKEKQGLAIFDANRERDILMAVSKQLEDSPVAHEIVAVFSEMLVSSKKAQARLLGRE